MSELTYKEAINLAIADAMAADDEVFLIGEDVGAAGGAFKATAGLQERFGSDRVLDSPISEQAIIGCAIGSAVQGLRPIAEIMFADFSAVCFDQIVNQLAKYRYMTDGQVAVPVTVRLANGAGGGFGAQHSQATENWFLNVPGLKVFVPATPQDAYDLLRAAVEDPDPVLYFEHKSLFNTRAEVSTSGDRALGASVARRGSDVTVVATQMMRHRALEAADLLSMDGIEVEVIDPRSLVPLDLETIRASVERTAHVICVQESCLGGSWAATVVTGLLRDSFEALDAPPLVIGGDDTPIPYARSLESEWLPSPERIADGIRDAVGY